MYTVLENPYRDIEYSSALNKFIVFAGVRPRLLIATCDTIEEAQTARDIHAGKRAAHETANFRPFTETRTAHA